MNAEAEEIDDPSEKAKFKKQHKEELHKLSPEGRKERAAAVAKTEEKKSHKKHKKTSLVQRLKQLNKEKQTLAEKKEETVSDDAGVDKMKKDLQFAVATGVRFAQREKAAAEMTPDEITGKVVEKQALSQVLKHIKSDDGDDLIDNFIASGNPNQETNTWLSAEVEAD